MAEWQGAETRCFVCGGGDRVREPLVPIAGGWAHSVCAEDVGKDKETPNG